MGSIWRSTRRFIFARILHADDTPHRIALGVGISTFVAFTPTMGLHMALAVSLAALARANKAVCIPVVWITNPLTFVPIYWSCWRLGAAVTGRTPGADELAVIRLLRGCNDGGSGFAAGLLSYDFWAGLLRLMFELGTELWIGCTIVGLVSGFCSYFATKWLVSAYRTRRSQRKSRNLRERRSISGKAERTVAVAGKIT